MCYEPDQVRRYSPVLIAGIAGLILGIMATCSHTAGTVEKLKAKHKAEQAEAVAKAEAKARKQERAADKVTTDIGKEAAEVVTKTRWKTQEVIRYVPQVLPPETVRAYPLPSGFIRLHDAAARGDVSSLSAGATGTDGQASDVGADQAAATIISNYGICHEALAKNALWVKWYDEQSALWNKAYATGE